MKNIKEKIKQLIVQGERLLDNIPKKTDYKIREKHIKDKYRSNEPAALIGREIISYGAGELVSDIFGAKKTTGKYLAKKVLKNQYQIQRDEEIKQLWQEYDNRCRNLSQQAKL